MKLNRIRQGVLCLALMTAMPWCTTGILTAQNTTEGAIAATVQDASGSVVSGAAVTLRNAGTDAEVTLTTDAGGYFKAPQLAPGIYTVTIKASGFGEYKATGVAVTVGSLTELHPTLQTGSTVESVEVSGDAPVLQFESPEISSTITAKEIVDLPLNGGRWSDLALLTPATVSDANGFGLIAFRGISPLIWRRLLVRSDATIADLHATLQLALGWTDEHLNRFVIQGREYGVAHIGGMSFRDDRDESGWLISASAPRALPLRI